MTIPARSIPRVRRSPRPLAGARIAGQASVPLLPEALEDRRLFALPSGYMETDMGTIPSAGSSSYDAGTGTFSLSGSGVGVTGTADSLHYVYTPVTGDFTYIAHEYVGTGPAGINDESQMGIALRSSANCGEHAVRPQPLRLIDTNAR